METYIQELPSIEQLSAQAVHTGFVEFDFSFGYGETWESFEAFQCPECDLWSIAHGPTLEPCERCGHARYTHGPTLEPCERCGHARYIEAGGPMMNYYYPLDIEGSEAVKLGPLPLCILEPVSGENGPHGLALTGGGMDLSWEICEAFIRLGYLPPAHFCALPRLAGKRASEKTLLVVEACRRSLEIVRSNLELDLRALEHTAQSLV